MRDSKGRFCKAKFKVGDRVDVDSVTGWVSRDATVVKLAPCDTETPYWVQGIWKKSPRGPAFFENVWCNGDIMRHSAERHAKPTPTIHTLIQQEIDRHAESARKAFAENDTLRGNAWAIRKDECEKILALVKGK